jgi:hypothetical protein
MANLLLIVAKDYPDSFEFLKKAFGGRNDIEIIVDRRAGQAPRMGQDRRARKNDDQLQTHGWVLVRRLPAASRPAGGSPAVPAASAAVSTRIRPAKKKAVGQSRPPARRRVATRKRRRRT